MKDDGSQVPRFHGSDVALIAFAVQEVLIVKGILDVDGNPVPTRVRARKLQQQALAATEVKAATATIRSAPHGKACKECGAHAVIKKDGCEFCENCGSIGSCG